MKQRVSKPLNTAVAVVFAIVVISALFGYSQHVSYQEKMTEFHLLQSLAYEHSERKKRWSLKESETIYMYLKSHPNRTKEEKRGGNIVMQFDQLSAGEFNRLSNRILNSMLVIKKLTLLRKDDSKGSIIVEFES